MFARRTALLGTALFLLAAPATAQDDVGCTETSPCTWVVDVRAGGFDAAATDLDATAGDWYVLSSFNSDDEAHTLRLAGYATTLHVPSDDVAESAAIRFSAAGTFVLRDEPSGDTLALRVAEADVLDGAAPASASTSAAGPSPSPEGATKPSTGAAREGAAVALHFVAGGILGIAAAVWRHRR